MMFNKLIMMMQWFVSI